MPNLVRSEWFKLRKDRSFLTLSWSLIAVSVLYPLLVVFDGEASAQSVYDFYRYSILGGNNYVMKLVPCLLAGFFISSEYATGTMKSIVSSGNSRISIYMAKLLVFSIGTVVIALILPLFMFGASAAYFGFHDMPSLGYVVQTVGLTIPYAAAFASIMAIFAIVLTDSGKTIGVLLLFFVMFDSILYGLSVKIAFFEPIYQYSVFKQLLDIVQMEGMDSGQRLLLWLVPIATYAALAIIGCAIFRSKEIK